MNDRILGGNKYKTCSLCGQSSEDIAVFDFLKLGENDLCGICALQKMYEWLEESSAELDSMRAGVAIERVKIQGDMFTLMKQELATQAAQYEKEITALKRRLKKYE